MRATSNWQNVCLAFLHFQKWRIRIYPEYYDYNFNKLILTIPLLEQCLFSIIRMLLFSEQVPNLVALTLLLQNTCQHNWYFGILIFYHVALMFFIGFLKQSNNLNNINWLIKNLKTLWYFFTDRVHLSNRTNTRRQFIFYHSVPMSSWYSFDWKGWVEAEFYIKSKSH